MIKLAFWLLLAVNIVVFVTAPEHPNIPITATSQNSVSVEPDKIRLSSTSSIPASRPEQPEELSEPACIEIGNFNPHDAAIFEKKMALSPDMASRIAINTASSYMVYIPPQENANKKIVELQEKGVNTYFLIREGKFRHAISLGIFKTEDSARKLVSELEKHNIQDIAIAERGKIKRHFAFRISKPDTVQLELIDKILASYPQATRKDCPKPDAIHQSDDAI